MAENTSVGNATISLDIEASGDLKAQVEKMTGVIGKQIEASLKNIGNLDFKGLADTISNTISKAIDNSMKNIQQSINKSINSALSNVKGIKIPIDFGIPTDSPAYKESAVGSISTPRAPPIPKINTGVNLDVVKSQIDNLTQSLDITNRKIEQQQEKLAGLKESYAMAFDGERKNKLQEEILKTEANINKLTAASDKAGFKLADLDAQFAALGNMAKDATAGVNAVDEKLKQTANTATRTSNSMKSMGKATHDTGNSFNNSHNSMSMFFGTMVKWGLIFPIIVKGITAIGTSLRNSLMINSQFANSLNLIRSNLMTAFMPIYQAILPAVNTLMSALATATAYIASFISGIFGKTYEQSFNAAKAMQTQVGALTQTEKQAKKTATSLTGVGNAATAAGNAAKKASGGLAGFDQINKLSGSNTKGAGEPGSGVITPITPMANMAPIESVTSKWAEGFKKVLGKIFEPFKKAWETYGAPIVKDAKTIIGDIIEILRKVGSTFMAIWSNPTTQKSIGFLVGIFKDLFHILTRIFDEVIKPAVLDFLDSLNPDKNPAAKKFYDIISLILGKVKDFTGYLAGDGLTHVIKFLNLLKDEGIIGVIKVIWGKIKDIFNKAVESIKGFFNGIGTWFGNVFTDAWNNIKRAFSNVGSFFSGVWETIKSKFTSIGSTIGNAIGGAFKTAVNSILSFAENTINGFIRNINKVVGILNHLPGVKISPLDTIYIPKLARGGVIDQPTLAMVGERGKEAVMPLENNTGWIDTLAGKLNSKGQNSDEVAKLLQVIIDILRDLGMDINLDGDKFARATIKQLNKRTRMTGKTELII